MTTLAVAAQPHSISEAFASKKARDRVSPPRAILCGLVIVVDHRGHCCRKIGNGHRLQPDATGTGEHGVEHALATKHDVFDALDHLSVDAHGLLKAGHVAGIHNHLLASSELVLNQVAVDLGKSNTRARELLHDKALAAKDAGLCLLVK